MYASHFGGVREVQVSWDTGTLPSLETFGSWLIAILLGLSFPIYQVGLFAWGAADSWSESDFGRQDAPCYTVW